jgi:hypothetical protein
VTTSLGFRRCIHSCFLLHVPFQAPFGLVNVKEVHIEKIIGVDSEDELDHHEGEQRTGRFTLRLYNGKQPSISSVYLVIDSKQDLVSISNMWVHCR